MPERSTSWPPKADRKKNPISPENMRKSTIEIIFNGKLDPEHPECIDKYLAECYDNPSMVTEDERKLMELHREACNRCKGINQKLADKKGGDILFPDQSHRFEELKKKILKAG